MKLTIQYGLYPAVLLGIGGAGALLIATHVGWSGAWLAFLLLCAIALTLIAERIAPYNPDWNRSHNDATRDILHAVINEGAIAGAVLLIPILAELAPWPSLWPERWPFALQLIFAILVLDFGITFAHYFSHRYAWLWRFHAVHHSVKRMYGFNGLMKHPVHQAIEMSAGAFPLILLGLPGEVALAASFFTALQLLVQHTNADIRLGPFKYIFAAAEGHRFHHQSGAERGDVNFGLFTLIWDHLLGTFNYERRIPFTSAELGIEDRPDYPQSYGRQLLEPFRAR